MSITKFKFSSTSVISEAELRQAFMIVNPDLPASTLNQNVSRVFPENATIPGDTTMDRATVIRRLQTSSVRRHVNKVKE